MTETNGRPRPPALIWDTPPCSLCSGHTELVDDRIVCPKCKVSWPANDVDALGTWDEPEEETCGAEHQPYTHLAGISDYIRDLTFRCVLAAGHEGQWHHGIDRDGDTHSWLKERAKL